MKRILLIITLLALSWKVAGAHDDYIPGATTGYRTQMDEHHKYHLMAFLDSLYRASREPRDTMLQEVWWYLGKSDFAQKLRDSLYRASREKGDSMLVHDPGGIRIDATLEMKYDTRTYIRETVALDSVPIVKCEMQLVSIKDGWKRLFCDTIGYRITREQVTERWVE